MRFSTKCPPTLGLKEKEKMEGINFSSSLFNADGNDNNDCEVNESCRPSN